MLKLIKDGAVAENLWYRAADLALEQALPAGNCLVSIDYWNANQDAIAARSESVAVVIDSTETPDQIQGDLKSIPMIAVNFPAFADGRGFSIARLLRERYNYQGELRAIGAPIRDQLSYLIRVGFNAFELAEHYDQKEALNSMKGFTDSYQTSVDQPIPLFRRRNASS